MRHGEGKPGYEGAHVNGVGGEGMLSECEGHRTLVLTHGSVMVFISSGCASTCLCLVGVLE